MVSLSLKRDGGSVGLFIPTEIHEHMSRFHEHVPAPTQQFHFCHMDACLLGSRLYLGRAAASFHKEEWFDHY